MARKKQAGFTLIELLVVIAILAILATLGMVQYNGVNTRARDSARRSDIYEISTALEVNKTGQMYMSLQGNQFSSFQWADPRGDAYCIAEGSPGNPGNTSAWGSNCPFGFVVVAPGAPALSFAAWKVCTFLENPGVGKPNVFCKSSSQ